MLTQDIAADRMVDSGTLFLMMHPSMNMHHEMYQSYDSVGDKSISTASEADMNTGHSFYSPDRTYDKPLATMDEFVDWKNKLLGDWMP